MDIRSAFLGLSFAFIWSSAFTSARIIVQYAPPLTALSLRFAISGLIGVLIARILGQSWRLERRQWIALVTFGICQNGLYLGLNFIALQHIQASLAAIIASTMPLLVTMASWLFLRERLTLTAMAGLIAGVLGVALIMGARLNAGADLAGVALCALAVLSLSAATMVLRGTRADGNALMIVGLQMLVGSAALLLPAMAMERWNVTWSWPLIGAFSYTVLFPGLLATLLWFALVQRIGAIRASVYHFLTPFFGVVIAATLLSEPLRLVDMIGVAIITAGILAVQLSKPRVPG